jgi:hypothetical protein
VITFFEFGGIEKLSKVVLPVSGLLGSIVFFIFLLRLVAISFMKLDILYEKAIPEINMLNRIMIKITCERFLFLNI